MEYTLLKRDGTFIKGELPPSIEKDKFCIMCAAAFGAGLTAHKEYNGNIKKLIIYGEKKDIIIKPYKNNILAVIGNERDVEEVEKEIKL